MRCKNADEVEAFRARRVMSVKALREGILDITHKHNPVWLKHVAYKNIRDEN